MSDTILPADRQAVSRTRTIGNDGKLSDTIVFKNRDTGTFEKEARPVSGDVTGPGFSYITNHADDDAKFEEKYRTWQEVQASREPMDVPADLSDEANRRLELEYRQTSSRKTFAAPTLPWRNYAKP